MNVLATDLDRTLLPNGRWPADPGAITLFNQLTRDQEVLVIYVTGRNLALTEQAITEFGIRHPHVLIGDVGTTVRDYRDGQWLFDTAWIEHVRTRCPDWDAAGVRSAVAGIAGLREQPQEQLGPFKQSYFVDHARAEMILDQVRERTQGRFDENAIYSHDPESGNGLLDFLPRGANKQSALAFVVERLGVDASEVVFCGDSGNDLLPLTSGFRGVLVRNADEQLVREINQARTTNPDLQLYFARGDFNGLSGYYASGVLEGACHYGILRFPS